GIRDFHVTGVQTCALPIYRAALLVHDMQAYFVDAFTPGVAPIEPAVAHIAALTAAARARGVPVFYTAQNGDQDRRDRGLQADLRSEERRVGKECRARGRAG